MWFDGSYQRWDEEHISHAHGTKAESFIRTEVDPFPKYIEKISTTGEKEEQRD